MALLQAQKWVHVTSLLVPFSASTELQDLKIHLTHSHLSEIGWFSHALSRFGAYEIEQANLGGLEGI